MTTAVRRKRRTFVCHCRYCGDDFEAGTSRATICHKIDCRSRYAREYMRAWVAANREYHNAYVRDWVKANPERFKAARERYLATPCPRCGKRKLRRASLCRDCYRAEKRPKSEVQRTCICQSCGQSFTSTGPLTATCVDCRGLMSRAGRRLGVSRQRMHQLMLEEMRTHPSFMRKQAVDAVLAARAKA